MLKLFKFLKPYTMPIIAVLVLIFFQTMAELYLPTLMSDIVNTGIVKGDTAYIWRIGGQMLLIAGVSGICIIFASFLSARVATGFGRDLRNMVFERAESFSLNEVDKFGTSSLITRTTNDITQVQTVTVMILRMMVGAPIMAIGGIIMAMSKDTKLSIILIILIPVLALMVVLISKSVIPLFKEMQNKVDKLNLVVREYLIGIRVIRAFNKVEIENKKFAVANKDLTDTAIKVNKIMASLMPLMMIIMNLVSVSIIWFGGIRINDGKMQVGDMMAFLQYAMQIMFSVIMVSIVFVMIPRAEASAVRINEVLATEPEIVDPIVPKKSQGKKGIVEFKNVSFRYAGAEKDILSDLNFKLNPGEINAVIGGTGSGKTTLISLIPRFYDISQGTILVDGIDVREYTQLELREKIGFVPQKAVLFSGSVIENMRYGKEDATILEIEKACEIAQATEFIENMENKFEAHISQGGTNISGGQKQRLSIARALVRRPEIYIFDDSFSALDFKTDAKLRAALKSEIGKSTALIVAQRVSTVMDADKIIVLDDGQIVGMGNHKELLKSCDVYREIVLSQLSEEELA